MQEQHEKIWDLPPAPAGPSGSGAFPASLCPWLQFFLSNATFCFLP